MSNILILLFNTQCYFNYKGSKNNNPFATENEYYFRHRSGNHHHGLWTDKSTGEIVNTYSILTMEANELMSYVHNNRERMPVILNKDDEKYWLSNLKSKEEIEHIITQYPSDNMRYEMIDDKDLWSWASKRFG